MIEVGKAYRLYGKMNNMKTMKPVNKDRFCTNLIYASVYECDSESKRAMMERELAYLQGQGVFEFRVVPEWPVTVKGDTNGPNDTRCT